MCKQVLLPQKVKQEMRKTFKVDRMRLNRALKFEINSPSAWMLRAAAYRRGGLLYNDRGYMKGFVPECETHHDHSTGTIRQEFGGGLEVRIDRGAGGGDYTAFIHMNGEEIAIFPDMTVEKWGEIVYAVQMIHNRLNG